MVVFAYNGEPTLCFQLANERGNSIREARLRAFLAVDEISREGHRLRRLRQPSGAGNGPPRRINWAAFDRIRPCPLP